LFQQSSQPILGLNQNCRGLGTKLPYLICNISSFNNLFIVLTETWLNNNFNDNELGLYNYNIFRCDRCNNTSVFSRGGGVLIGIHKDYLASLISVPDFNVEHVFVRFQVGHSSFVLGGVYFPPNSSPILYESHINSIDYINKNYPAHAFILCGEYNFPEISWDTDDHGLIYSSFSHSRGTCIPEAFATCGFFQKNNIGNHFDSILDLVLSSNKLLCVEVV